MSRRKNGGLPLQNPAEKWNKEEGQSIGLTGRSLRS
ncbi:hypothetical protein FH603_81 [Spirosoma sp. LMG 31447]|uniref:Integrase n=1 Tax=Spirosoma utsteinense TaxID=2585773 RepID=A0ABR6VZ64_9BACT|nr:hypothetical protein [Spirosoma utsteinense]